MDPVKFGPFLKGTRTKRELTQAQLAERLHVSVAAVSKWERGKCLPDIAKLEELAAALDLSILEVIKCEAGEPAGSKEELTEVYAETLKTAKRQTRRRVRRLVAAAVCITVLLGLFHYFPIHHVLIVMSEKVFTSYEVSKLAYIGSRQDRQTAQLVLAQAEQAFSDITSTQEEAREKYGELSKYATPSDHYAGVVGESHFLRLWSARFTQNDGIVWVYCFQEAYDEEINTVHASSPHAALWRVQRWRDGTWKVVRITESP